ncbi:ABCC1, partial [Symbiodinium sp. CCMP2592]
TWMQQDLAATQDSGLELSKRRGDDFCLEDCSIGWTDGDRFGGVRSLNLRVTPGELLLISGPVGSGKTLLLEGLAGTRTTESGVCQRAGRSTAFVAQRPWLLNGSLLENVLFGQHEMPEKLQRTLESCALMQDLDALPSGIHTLVGEEGVQLSGGQKQRVSLARAVYSSAEVVLLDDVLSALDAHVGQHVWEKAICGALDGRTRVLVTHQIQYWSHPAVSRILMLRKDGSTEFLGTYQELSAEPSLQPRLSPARTGSSAQEAPTEPQPSAAPKPGAAAPSREQSSQEMRRTGHILRADLLAYAKACGGLGGVSVIAVLMVAYYGVQLASSLQLAAWSNANVAAEDSGHPEARDQSRRYLVQYLILCLLTGISCFSFFYGIQIVALRASREMHTLFVRGLIRTELRFFDLTPTGRALNRCLKDMATLDDNMPAAFRMLFECFMNCCISLLVLGLYAWEALVIVPPFMVLYWMIMTVYRWPARDLRRLEGVSRSPGMSHFSDSVKGANTIRAYGHEARFLQQNLNLLGQTQRTVYWFWVAQAWVSTSQEVLGTVALAVIAGVVGYRAYVGSLSPGLAGLALSYAMSMPRDLMYLSRRWASMEVEFVSIERIMEYARLRTEEEAAPSLGASATAPASVAVFAQDLYLQYDSDSPLVFNGLSLSIPRGARAALVGRTGCGKSSFLSAIVRLYPLQKGHLQVHGRDVHSVSLAALRSTVRVLLQDPIFFTGTIRSNLLSQPPRATASGTQARHSGEEEALWNCLRKAGLEDRIASLAKGLDVEVEENGLNFSQGERQLLCLARVLMERPE